MTYKDLLDTLVVDSGDAGTTYRANAWRWLNLVRQDAALKGEWKSSKKSPGTFTTDPANTSGIYPLVGIDDVIGDEMYDDTHHLIIQRDTENMIYGLETTPYASTFPRLWADAGMSDAGEKRIRIWPPPTETFDISFIGRKALIDVSSANENATIDAYFGPLSSCGSMLAAGLRYYHDVNNNEDISTIGRSQGRFDKMISIASQSSGLDTNATSRMEPVNRRSYARPMGRFDPGHFSNR